MKPSPEEAVVIPEWLTTKVTPREAEASHTAHPTKEVPDPVPFGRMNDQWKELLAGMQPGDELWEFRSPPDSWMRLAGRAGFAVVRDGQIVTVLTTMMN